MGGLAHFFEEEGIPTTMISLVREHTEKMKPPRALWVPFELGRPIGAPNNREFQMKVLTSVLKLLEAKEGPILVDFDEEDPTSEETITNLVCPVNFAKEEGELTDTEKMLNSVKAEMNSLRPWYDMALDKRGRTTVGISGIDLDRIVDFIGAFFDGGAPQNPRGDMPLSLILNFATDDLKAFYYESITAQPGQESPSGKVLEDWFWGETKAGKMLLMLKESCKKSDDPMMQAVARIMIVPSSQAYRRKEL
ncbi:MAG: hypothetical protein JW984_01675 [Deltaproteobacteria bacterium]|uniref:Uncharacterized protein n=1 Tax=Candidatus Zymogenus saltonus TaxID=2844893 RepID=A0A9D8K9S3_9DELT|nr:hypothetical protein [Candidatus Zymogenus saltonus]